ITITATDLSNNSSECTFVLNEQSVSVNAGIDKDITEGQEVQLNAIAAGTGTYFWSPSIGLNDTNISNPIANPIETTTYIVTFTNTDGCTAEDEVTVYVESQQSDDETKYGFSPDSDGINEFWKIGGIENYPKNKVSIYNRWGDLVFEIEGYNNTSRVFSGIANRKRNMGANELPEGTYFFDIKIDGSHTLKKVKGFIVLKR
ncbi:gliding motility-associated C-terminal domain-containing protein, partial [Mariniflexile sp. HMF6888]|uniref:gliding motility-associated C-terminal domain-containing protein n=1 Tax=Mariniflexile sp. HMF6888 TaxID=3373086 RepID=UPI0037A584CD